VRVVDDSSVCRARGSHAQSQEVSRTLWQAVGADQRDTSGGCDGQA